ncbi:MAG: efflux RND transporter permease subunit [Candidatus Loosdrechtia sp.]|uniref:efflux RND transporter permease subunit n=1 Tax=Candidatus Loosdrechtia sp. TaxID=3101272 RepID=UPI003A5FB4FC|nr:MAG: efflux RND transporter permease subunit [Candidatus Jettenia sp. AMX2]
MESIDTMNDSERRSQQNLPAGTSQEKLSFLDKIVRFCLENKLVVVLIIIGIVGWGILVAPFDWEIGGLPRSPVPVDAIPDIGENQQIVFTEWEGRSPQDVEDQITYPLTTSLLGVPGVKTIRSFSMFGFSTIFIIFDEKIDFYWSRSRVLEKLSSLPPGILPEGVAPAMGPDATALGQIFWYTLEGRDPDGNPIGGWDMHELRTIQDWYVRYYLLAAEGISEVASIGGYVQEYQIDVDPDAMRAARVTLEDIFMAVRMSNIDVGARTIEVNKVEYIIRGLGFIKNIRDIEMSVVKVNENVPIYIRDVAHVTLGSAFRRGALDKEGAEATGGVVVVRYAFNPLEAIKNVKEKIKEVSAGLPTKAVIDYKKVSPEEVRSFALSHGFDAFISADLNQEKWLKWLRATPRDQWPEWVNTSQVTIVPFYDRTGLIYETLETLKTALTQQIFVTVIVVIVMVMHLRSSILISGLLPIAVLMCFIAMKTFGVDANIVALSGIAIAIGTMVDMGIIMCENILKHLDEADPDENRLEVIFRASREVSGAVLTAVSTTIISFLPVFTMIGPEGKLFKPLAFTKTFALFSSVIVAIMIIPPIAHVLFTARIRSQRIKQFFLIGLIIAGIIIGIWFAWWAGLIITLLGTYYISEGYLPRYIRRYGLWIVTIGAALFVGILLTGQWLPLGPEKGMLRNLFFITILIGGLLLFFQIFVQYLYAPILGWCLDHKKLFLLIPTLILLMGVSVWMGFDRVFGFIPNMAKHIGIKPETIRETSFWNAASDLFPGLGKEFMPPLDEGSYLYMPTTMPHASIDEVIDILRYQDKQLISIPEVEMVVGKLGRAETPLDPAPVSMIETVINYKSEYVTDENGRRINFQYDTKREEFVRDEDGNLIPDPQGRPFRQWRDHIRSPDDIWEEIIKAAEIPGTTSAPKLQPIAARVVMLQTGMRAPIGVKVYGPDLETIERVSLDIERFLKEVPSVESATVIADRIVGKPYLEIDFNREAIARYGLTIQGVQDVVEIAIGGRQITTTVEGRERYPVRVRYLRELRDQIETLGRILVTAHDGAQIPITQVADIRYVRGPQEIKSEDTFLVGYVLFDKKPEYAEVNVVEDCQRYLQEKIMTGEFSLPAGVSYRFAGAYEHQIRAQKTLSIVLPLSLLIIFLILYFHFRSTITTSLVFTGIMVAWAGGFIMIWLYAQPWFLDFEVFGTNMRTLFQVHTINLSVAIWVGFLALFGIATDDGVVMATYLDQSFWKRKITSYREAREATIAAGLRRVRPCLMTTATTVLALLPVLTSTGRGSDIMVPMAIPSFGGMFIEIMTMLIVPTLYCAIQELKLKHGIKDVKFTEHEETK